MWRGAESDRDVWLCGRDARNTEGLCVYGTIVGCAIESEVLEILRCVELWKMCWE